MFDAYTFDMCTNKVYLLTYLLRNRLSAGLCSDPLAELTTLPASQAPPNWIGKGARGGYRKRRRLKGSIQAGVHKRGRNGKERGGKSWKGIEGKEERDGKGKGRKNLQFTSPNLKS